MINKCNDCGKFRARDDLVYRAGDCDDAGAFDEWFECRCCRPNAFKSDRVKETENE